MNANAALIGTGPLMNTDERSCSAQGCLAVPLKPKTSPAWPPFSTGALAGGRKGGGMEGADRAWGCFFKPLMNTQAALMRTGPLMDTHAALIRTGPLMNADER
jgi:hypothetical protein